jgi:yecA family protein
MSADQPAPAPSAPSAPTAAAPPLALADFPALAHLSDLSDLALSPSEAHGIFCGLLCGGERDSLRRWLDEVLPLTPHSDHDSANCRAALTQIAEQTRARIEGPERAFAPLLPSSEAPLVRRAEAVNDWSRGFLYGLGLKGRDPSDFSAVTREVIADLTEVTRLDLDALDAPANSEEQESQEQDLAELTEFLWVAAMMVYEEAGPVAAR